MNRNSILTLLHHVLFLKVLSQKTLPYLHRRHLLIFPRLIFAQICHDLLPSLICFGTHYLTEIRNRYSQIFCMLPSWLVHVGIHKLLLHPRLIHVLCLVSLINVLIQDMIHKLYVQATINAKFCCYYLSKSCLR